MFCQESSPLLPENGQQQKIFVMAKRQEIGESEEVIVPETPEDMLKNKKCGSHLAKPSDIKSEIILDELLSSKPGKKCNGRNLDSLFLSRSKRKSVALSPDVLGTNKKATKQTSLLGYVVPQKGYVVPRNQKCSFNGDQKHLVSELCGEKCNGQPAEEKNSNTKSPVPSDLPQWTPDADWDAIKDDDLIFMDMEGLSPRKVIHSSQGSSQQVLGGPVVYSNMKFIVTAVECSSVCEKRLTLKNPDDTCIRRCILKEFWYETHVMEGDYAHVLAPFMSGCAVIDNNNGYIIINPDYLVSSTAVVSTLRCLRKAYLQEKLRLWDSSGNFIMLIGNLVHQLFQEAVSDGACEETQIEDIATKIMKRVDNLFAMYSQDASENEVRLELSRYVTSISKWIKEHCVSENSVGSLKVVDVRDIEDNIWCPKLGLKGKIDLTLEVKIPGKHGTKVTPLELKTGKPSFSAEHEGQVHLYTMMMEDRSNDVGPGLLLYLKDGPQMKHIPPDHSLRRGLIQLRNLLAHHLKMKYTRPSVVIGGAELCGEDLRSLPEPINNKRLCSECSYLLPCCFYQRIYKDFAPADRSHAMATLVPSVTSHLSVIHLQYFHHWSKLLTAESVCDFPLQPFWNVDAYTREKEGLCISHVHLCDNILTQQEREGAAFVHTFVRAPDCPISPYFSSVGLTAGDYVVISNQKNSLEVALATGFIAKISNDLVEVSIERDLQKLSRYEGYLFRIDKQHSNTAQLNMYSNLTQLMSTDPVATHLRQLIIEYDLPAFVPVLKMDVIFSCRDILKSLNKPQRKAILKALTAKDYMLLKGMPGTGKTSTIVALVRMMVRLGHCVLLASHTHSAIDNILLKLIPYNVDFLRIGQIPRMHPDVRPFSFQTLTKDMTSVSQLAELICSKMVVASTCLGANNNILKKRQFDICIVDEASQILQVACLGPLYYAKKFILVGDPKQLPPVVRSEPARLSGMQESLFSRLEKLSDTCTMELCIQYRMNQEIMRLCNELTYDGALQCGSKSVASATLQLDTLSSKKVWLSQALDPALLMSVVFLNTDEISARESRDVHGLVKNDVEVNIATQLVECVVEGGLPAQNVGVVSPYRCQVELIRKSLQDLHLAEVEVNTVDQYQGRDKDVIVISCVKSADERSGKNRNMDLSIVGDERRLNVAITRAKKKLVIIGSRSTLILYDSFRKLINCLKTEQILSLQGPI